MIPITDTAANSLDRAASFAQVKFLRGKGFSSPGAFEGWDEWTHRGAHCTSIVLSAGIQPSRATIVVENIAEVRPIAHVLNPDWEKQIPMFSRVVLTVDKEIVFIGNRIGKPVEARGGLMFAYEDDRILLAHTPLRGAIYVADNAGVSSANYSTRFKPVFNPGGFCNMSELSDVPLFRRTATRLGYSKWTPYKALKYVRHYLLNVESYATNALGLDSNRMVWPEGNIPDWDAETEGMNADLPTVAATGQAVLMAMVRILEIGGTAALYLKYRPDYKSEICFAPRDSTAATGKKTISIPYTGTLDDVRIAQDFSGSDRGEKAATEVLIDGAVEEHEGALTFVPDNAATTTLCASATAADELAFLTLVGAETEITDARRAAINAARVKYPRVYRAFRLPTDATDGDAATVESFLTDSSYGTGRIMYPLFRAALRAQLTTDATSGEQYPVRVQVSNDAGGTYHDVASNDGLSLDDYGNIYLAGLTDDAAQYEMDLLYGGDTATATTTLYQMIWRGQAANDGAITTPLAHHVYWNTTTSRARRYNGATWENYERPVRLNIAFPVDMRTYAHEGVQWTGYDPNAIADRIDPTIRLQHYILSPDSYRLRKRIASVPYSGAGPYTDTLVDERAQATQSAKKRARDVCRIQDKIVAQLIGVRADIRAGDFLDYLKYISPGSPPTEGGKRTIMAMLAQVTYDFESQQTRLEPE